MAVTLNISLSEEQAAWVKSRKRQGDYASVSDVVRDMIRQAKERDEASLKAEWEQLDKGGMDPKGSEAEPAGEVLKVVQQVKKERREAIRRS